MRKTILLLIASITISINCFSQITYLADTAFTTDIGYGGAPASCRCEPNGYWLGLNMNHNTGFWLADFFTVPASSTWVFDTVIIYGYERGSSTISTFTGGYLRIYAGGPPGLGGSLIWGDSLNNIMASTSFTGIYRVDTAASNGGLTSTFRPIMSIKLYLSPAPSLTSGTYWLAWSSKSSGTYSPDCPPKVLPGRINPTGQNGRSDSSGVWSTITDYGHTLGFNMIIKASASVSVPGINNLRSFTLDQNTPNPFNESTKISFHLAQDSYTTLCVYNILGQLVNTLTDGNLNSGDHSFIFNAHELPPGLYYYRLKTNAGIESKQMQLVH